MIAITVRRKKHPKGILLHREVLLLPMDLREARKFAMRFDPKLMNHCHRLQKQSLSAMPNVNIR
jgi:hypothetical protein